MTDLRFTGGLSLVVASVLIVATGAASYLPARRECRIDPVRALRHE